MRLHVSFASARAHPLPHKVNHNARKSFTLTRPSRPTPRGAASRGRGGAPKAAHAGRPAAAVAAAAAYEAHASLCCIESDQAQGTSCADDTRPKKTAIRGADGGGGEEAGGGGSRVRAAASMLFNRHGQHEVQGTFFISSTNEAKPFSRFTTRNTVRANPNENDSPSLSRCKVPVLLSRAVEARSVGGDKGDSVAG